MGLNLLLLMSALALALTVRPWRGLGQAGPPWPWLAWWAAMPLLWGMDRIAAVPLVQPLSGAPLLLLLAGWPMTMLALPALALVMVAVGGMAWPEALQRLVWLGVVPATLALVMGAALRRWLPQHLFIYILGRGFFTPWAATAASGALALLLVDIPQAMATDDLLLARFLIASGEGVLTGMLTAVFVAFRPQWLATYSDRLYLPRD